MLTGVVVCLLAVIALLAVPVTMRYQVSWRQSFQGRVTLLWLFGLVRVRIPTGTDSTEEAAGRETAAHRRQIKSKRTPSRPLAAIRQKPFRQRVLRFIRDCWRAIRKRHLSLRVRIGLGDPADTGQLWALVGPVSGMLATVEDASIAIEPEFIDTVFELDSSGDIRIVPLQVLYLVAGLLLSPAFWRGMNQMRGSAREPAVKR